MTLPKTIVYCPDDPFAIQLATMLGHNGALARAFVIPFNPDRSG
ncbi:hypothetical protein OO012_14970 [Rhodobacteraceae bacterium KMM 6894]|nr:hypothetical protein [Rhodobacteraceae bacterium KMM 6894]